MKEMINIMNLTEKEAFDELVAFIKSITEEDEINNDTKDYIETLASYVFINQKNNHIKIGNMVDAIKNGINIRNSGTTRIGIHEITLWSFNIANSKIVFG